MNWKVYWDKMAATSTDHHQQVGRISDKEPISDNTIEHIAEHIKQNLQLQPSDVVLDVCCGNGLITFKLSHYCNKIIGIDISAVQLEKACKNYSAKNITFMELDVINIAEHLNEKADKINLYFSFQYFDTYKKGMKAIEALLKCVKPQGLIFIGAIADYNHLRTFYNSPPKVLHYYLNKWMKKNSMGKFWRKEELDEICKSFAVKGTFLNFTSPVPYSNYRFDYLIETCPR